MIWLCACLFFGVLDLAGQTWTGATNNSWSTSTNWSPNAIPGNWASRGAIVYLNDTPGSNQSITTGYDRQLSELQMTSSYDYTLNSGEIKFQHGSKTLSLNGSGDLILNTNTIFTGGGNGYIDADGPGVVTFNGNMAGQGGTVVNFIGSGETVTNGTFGGDLALGGTGTNTFNGTFNGGSTVTVTGGTNVITSNIGGGATIEVNVSSGSLSIEGDIGGGANIDVDNGQLALSGTLGNGGSVSVQSGGTLLLEDGADLGGGGSNVELNGGTLAVSADSVSVYSLTLSADSTIDLLDDPDADIYLGNINGGGVVNIINYQDTQQVTYNPGGSSIDVPTQFFFDGIPAEVIDGNRIVPGISPIPEPGTIVFGIALTTFAALHTWRRRKQKKEPRFRGPTVSQSKS